MEFKIRKNINEPCTSTISLALSQVSKQKVDALKMTYKIDLNQMLRDYINEVFDQARKGKIISNQE